MIEVLDFDALEELAYWLYRNLDGNFTDAQVFWEYYTLLLAEAEQTGSPSLADIARIIFSKAMEAPQVYDTV